MAPGKIAIVTNDKKTVAAHAGRCKYIVTCCIGSEGVLEKKILENAQCRHDRPEQHNCHGPGHACDGEHSHSHDGILGLISDCDIMITAGMGQRLIRDAVKAGIRPVTVEPGDRIDWIIEQYLESAANS